MPGAFFEPLGLPLGFLAGGSATGGTGESSLGPSRISSSLSMGAALTGVVTYEGFFQHFCEISTHPTTQNFC